MAGRQSPKKISEPALRRIAAEFQVLSDAMRLRILNELRGGEKNVTAIIAGTKATQSNISKHLGVLRRAGFVTGRRDGLQVFYSVCDPTVDQLCEVMCSKFQAHFEKRSGRRTKR